MSRPVSILGISAFYHDSAACLVRDGQIIAAAQEERFTRKKHDANFPKHAVEYCLREGGLQLADLEYVAFYEKPFLKFDRILHSYLAYAPRGLKTFLMAIPLWIRERVWMKTLIQEELGSMSGSRRREEAERAANPMRPPRHLGGDNAESNLGMSATDWQHCPTTDWLRVTCRAGAIVLLVGFWFDGGLFKLATASVFWILLELGRCERIEQLNREHVESTMR